MFGCNTHLLKHIKQAILAWSFRQNIILGCYPVFAAISARGEFIVCTTSPINRFAALVEIIPAWCGTVEQGNKQTQDRDGAGHQGSSKVGREIFDLWLEGLKHNYYYYWGIWKFLDLDILSAISRIPKPWVAVGRVTLHIVQWSPWPAAAAT